MTTKEHVLSVLDRVTDPEIPVISVRELGVLRQVDIEGEKVIVTITPTYSGCPAMDAMRQDIEKELRDAGIDNLEVIQVLSPAWTTDWISDEGKRKLKAYGIAPPEKAADFARQVVEDGIRYLQIKVPGDPVVDLAIVKAIRKSVGDDIVMHPDVNRGYKDAKTAINSTRAPTASGKLRPLPSP